MGSSRISVNSRPAGSNTLNTELFKHVPETVEKRLVSILHVGLY